MRCAAASATSISPMSTRWPPGGRCYYAQVFAQGTDEFLSKTEALYQKNTTEQRGRRSGPVGEGRGGGQPGGRRGGLFAAQACARRHAQPPARPTPTASSSAGRWRNRTRSSRPRRSCTASPWNAGRTSRRSGSAWTPPGEAYRLARANRFADAYLLYQPFTYQNNAPFGTQSATSWALGITVPLPVYNRNQGNIERARINIHQSRGAVGRPSNGRSSRRSSRHSANTGSAAGSSPRSASGVLPVLKRAIADREYPVRGKGRSTCSGCWINGGPTTTAPRPIVDSSRPASQGDADAQHGGGAAHPAVIGGNRPSRSRESGRPAGGDRGAEGLRPPRRKPWLREISPIHRDPDRRSRGPPIAGSTVFTRSGS